VLIKTIQYSSGKQTFFSLKLTVFFPLILDNKLFVGTQGRGAYIMNNAMHAIATARNIAG
jgi:hypothetical protein